MNKDSRVDLRAWHLFIDNFNGKAIILFDRWNMSASKSFFTDASNIGFGGYLGEQWFAGIWPSWWNKLHITIKELFPIVVAVELFHDIFTNKNVMFYSDNMAVVHIINQQTSKDNLIMCLVRRLVVNCLKFNIMFKAKHIPGLNNTLADNLSRQQIQEFLRTSPFLWHKQVMVPAASLVI